MTSQPTETGGLGVEVELDIFSGRPNPRWVMAPQTAERLRAELSERVPAEPVGELGLGYRGFLLTNRGLDRSIPSRLRVYRSSVTVLERERETSYQDTQGVEETLLEQARTLGYGDAIAHFRMSR